MAYAPFVEALTDWARRTPSAALGTALAGDAAVVARLAPAIRQILPDTGDPLPVPADAETARLHDAVGQVLARLGETDPVVLIIEDLHWADDATVGMLRALARQAARNRLVIIGTYRETDLDRRHPFAQALPLLQREVEPTRLSLDGLEPHDVHELLERLSGQAVPEAFADLLARETDGNPFFLRETLLHLVEEGRLRFENGAWVTDGSADLGIPAGVREVVGRRLSRLSKEANRLLAAGALFEVSFPLAIAAAVTDLDDEGSLDAIDEALEARIVAPTDEFDRYAFTHALFRHTLVEELNPSRQVRMHRAIAEAIEKGLRGLPDPGTAATLARHFLRSAAIPGAERGVPYALAVADDAAGRYARHEELAALRTALELVEPGDDRSTMLYRRVAMAGVLAQIDPAEQLAAAEEAGRLVAEEEGPDAACDFVTELLIAARPLEDTAVCWRLGELGRSWMRPERRDRQWAFLRDTELLERSFHDPLAPGIPTEDHDYRELRGVVFTLSWDDRLLLALCAQPSSRSDVEAELAMHSDSFFLHFLSGRVRDCSLSLDLGIDRARGEGLVGLEAFYLTMQSRCLNVLGEFDLAAGKQAQAETLLPRLAPTSNYVFQVLATPMLRDALGGVDLSPEAVEFLLAFADRPGTQWAGLVLRLAAARGLASAGKADTALEILDSSIIGIDRAGAWAPNAPMVFAYAVRVVWALSRTDHLTSLERNIREKWLDPDLCYPGCDSRWSMALLCALDGRIEEARHLFAEARMTLLEQESDPVIVGVDYDAALMEVRLGRDGDAARFADCLTAARTRCGHPVMAGWLPKLDDLEAQAATAF